MQPHEGPRRNSQDEKRRRQDALTRHLFLAIVVLAAAVFAAMLWRWG